MSAAEPGKRQLRILLVAHALNVGGVERKIELLARGLVARGHHVDVGTFYPQGILEDRIRATGARVISIVDDRRVPRVRGWIRVRRWFMLRQLIRRERYDVVYSLGAHVNTWALMARVGTGSKVIWGIEAEKWRQKALNGHVEARLSSWADLVISVSESTRRSLVSRGFPPSSTITIDNSVDIERFRVEPEWRAAVRGELRLSGEEILVGTAGRLHQEKNTEGVIVAAQAMFRDRDGVRMLIVGPGRAEYRRALEALADRLGIGDRVIWIGARDDVERYLNAMDVFISASRAEGFPLTWVEALACGTPCVVTDVSDAHRIIGDMGRVVPVDDPEATATAIEEVLADPKLRDRQRIRQWTVENFSAERQVDRTEAALLSLLPDSRDRAST